MKCTSNAAVVALFESPYFLCAPLDLPFRHLLPILRGEVLNCSGKKNNVGTPGYMK